MKHLKLLLKTLFSNNACVEAARTREKKYNIFAIIFALLGLFLAVLPMTVNGYQNHGRDWINGNVTYNISNGLYDFTKKVKELGVTFTIDDKHELTIGNSSNMFKEESDETEYKIVTTTSVVKVTTIYQDLTYYCKKSTIDEDNNMHILEVYDLTTLDDKDFNAYAEALLSNINPFKAYKNPSVERDIKKVDVKDNWISYSQTVGQDGTLDASKRLGRSNSCIIFGKKSVVGALYQNGNTTSQGSVAGDYLTTKPGDLFATYGLDKAGSVENVLACWKNFFDDSYIVNRRNSTWKSTGIMIGVDVGVLIFMGLMVFILTRGKNNPFRIYSFWDCQKISYYASLTPGILALFGFLLKPMAMMFFVLILGVRVMWCSMRTLRYTPNAQK